MSHTQTTQSGHFHAVRFYDSPESLARIVAAFMAEGFTAHEPALAIATPEHRIAIEAALRAKGWDVDALLAAGDLSLLDADETLSRFMVDGMPDSRRFEEVASQALEHACRGRRNCTIRAYGEMVDVLWKRNQTVAAIRLEMLWNKLATTHDFSLLCGYAMGNFYKDAQRSEVRQLHTHQIGDDEYAQPVSTIN
jgi:hypothetical protein